MQKRSLVVRGAIVWVAIFSFAGASPARAASGGGDGGSTGYSNAEATPGQKAISEYRKGEQKLERAQELRLEMVEAEQAGDGKKVAKLEKKANGMYGRAARYFRKAIKYDEGLFQAWSSLGYSLRRQGEYGEALKAYDQAIELEPRYSEAVEYRAEAYLHLGRLDDVKTEYVRLAGWVKPKAAMLMVKMQEWQVAHAADPGDFDPDEVAEFGTWLDERRTRDGMPETVAASKRAEW